jgi:hypothetical protein
MTSIQDIFHFTDKIDEKSFEDKMNKLLLLLCVNPELAESVVASGKVHSMCSFVSVSNSKDFIKLIFKLLSMIADLTIFDDSGLTSPVSLYFFLTIFFNKGFDSVD